MQPRFDMRSSLAVIFLFLIAALARAANYIGDQTFAAPFTLNEGVNVVGNLTLASPGTYSATSWNIVGLVRFAQPGEYFFVATGGGIAGSGNVLGPTTGTARVHVSYRTSVNFVGSIASNLVLVDDAQTTLPPLEVVNPPPPSPLMNISTRAVVMAGGSLTSGFVIGGNSPRRVLVRAVGPGLAAFGVPGTMSNPTLAIFNGSLQVTTNDDWDGGSALRSTFAAVGAFGLASASRDAAVVVTLQPGAYTTVVRSAAAGEGGEVLIEVYFVE